MGGMAQVPRKSPVGIRMAFLASLNHLIKTNVGIGIINFQDIMGPVTVGTFGCFQISQSIGFAVHRIQVGFSQRFVAAPTLIGDFRKEFILVAHFYFMGGMAVSAGGQFFLRLGYGRAMNALGKYVINPPMAGAASSRKILDMN